MPEGDSLRRAALSLQVLVGQRMVVETPHPRAAGKRLVERLDGAGARVGRGAGKNLLLRFEGGLVLRSHLRMSGRWRVEPRGAPRTGRPWLVLRGDAHEAVLWNGPVLELRGTGLSAARAGHPRRSRRTRRMLERLRAEPPERELGDALARPAPRRRDREPLEGRVALGRARLPVAAARRGERREVLAVLAAAHRLMRTAVEGTRPLRHVYRRAGRACHRCGTPIRSHPQGENARIAYWCPGCQRGGREPA